MVNQPVDIFERRRKLLEERAKQAGATPLPATPQQPPPNTPPAPKQPWEQDNLPDLNSGSKSDDDVQMDNIIDSISFPQAYNKWINKGVAVQTKQDGNMIRCPLPEHVDNDPSAWFDDQGRWHCGGCEEGGDIYDLAAIHFGYPRPGYKDGANFHRLREDMASSFGWTTKKVPGGTITYQAPADEAVVEVSTAPPVEEGPGLKIASEIPDEPAPPVAVMYADEDLEDDAVLYPEIKWQNLIPEDTFLYEFMNATCNDDSPEEYHFWHGLLALGHAVGRNVTLDDSRPVYSNLMVCLLGATGVGKSRSRGWLDTVLKAAVPYSEDGTRASGCKIVAVPASGEYLVSAFNYEGKDPSNNNRSLGYQSVNGVVDFDEMSALLARANREGSTLKPTIMALSDARDEVKIGSLTRGDYVAHKPFCSITASTQPKAIRVLLSRNDTGSGFLNRWIFAGGREKETEALGGSHSSTVINLDKAITELKGVRAWGSVQRSLTLEPDAYQLYIQYFKESLEPAKRNDDTDLLKRIDLISKKLMLLLTINLRRETVPVQVVRAVINLMDYVVNCFGILNSNIGITVMQDVMNEILRHIKRHKARTGRGASARDLARYTARKNFSLEQIKKALEVMSALDIIELAKKNDGPGRPAVRYLAVGE